MDMKVNLFSNRVYHDVVSMFGATGPNMTGMLAQWKSFVTSADAAEKKPLPAKNDAPYVQKFSSKRYYDACLDVPETVAKSRYTSHVPGDWRRGVRAGYLVGGSATFFLTALFGEPSLAANVGVEKYPARTPRCLYGTLRPRPVFKRVFAEDGLLGCLYVGTEGMARWAVGCVGAFIGAAGFAPVRGALVGARWIAALSQGKAPQASQLRFTAGLRVAAQLGRIAGEDLATALIAFPFVIVGVLSGVSTFFSAAVQGVACIACGLIGAFVGLQRDVFGYRGNVAHDAAALFRGAGRKLGQLGTQARNVMDPQYRLYRACLANARRAPEEVEEEIYVGKTPEPKPSSERKSGDTSTLSSARSMP